MNSSARNALPSLDTPRSEGVPTPLIRTGSHILRTASTFWQNRNCVWYKPSYGSRVFLKGMAFEMLEPCAMKVACTVLRGLGAGNGPRLPDSSATHFFHRSQDIVSVISRSRWFFPCIGNWKMTCIKLTNHSETVKNNPHTSGSSVSVTWH